MPSNLLSLLTRVYLGGIVKECVLHSGDDGFCSVQAIDMTNSMFVDVGMETELIGLGQLGLSNIGMLAKYLEHNADQEIEVSLADENRLVLKTSSSKLMFLLSEPDMIPTVVENPNMMVELVETYAYTVPLDKNHVDELLTYYGIVKPASISFEFTKNGTIVRGGLETEHQFTIQTNKPQKKAGGALGNMRAVTVTVFSQHLMAVLSALVWSENEIPQFLFTTEENKPLVIQQNADCLWALVPAVSD